MHVYTNGCSVCSRACLAFFLKSMDLNGKSCEIREGGEGRGSEGGESEPQASYDNHVAE